MAQERPDRDGDQIRSMYEVPNEEGGEQGSVAGLSATIS